MSGREGIDVKLPLWQSVRLVRLATLEKMESMLLSTDRVGGYVSVCECLLALSLILADVPAVVTHKTVAGLFFASSSANRTVRFWAYLLSSAVIPAASVGADSCRVD